MKIINLKLIRNTVLCATALLVLVVGCAKKEAPKAPEPAKADPVAAGSPEDQIKHKILAFNLEGLSDNGSKQWDVMGQSAESISESQVKLVSIVANSYGDEAQATITADEGIYDKTQNNVRLEKNVKAVIDSTESFGNQMAGLSGPEATGAKDKSEKKERSRTDITCDGEVQFDYEKNQAYFNKNVLVANEDVTINADKITVNLEPQTKKVNNIVAEGNVRIKKGDNITYSDRATYVEADKKIVLIGRPRMVIYQESGFEGGIFGANAVIKK